MVFPIKKWEINFVLIFQLLTKIKNEGGER